MTGLLQWSRDLHTDKCGVDTCAAGKPTPEPLGLLQFRESTINIAAAVLLDAECYNNGEGLACKELCEYLVLELLHAELQGREQA